MVLDFLKRKKVIAVSEVSFPLDSTVVQVESFERLCELGQTLVETDNDYFARGKEGIIFRFCKPNGKPRLLKVSEMTVSPDSYSVKAKMSMRDLVNFARKGMLPLFETDEIVCMPGDPFLWASKKGEQKL